VNCQCCQMFDTANPRCVPQQQQQQQQKHMTFAAILFNIDAALQLMSHLFCIAMGVRAAACRGRMSAGVCQGPTSMPATGCMWMTGGMTHDVSLTLAWAAGHS
jgi:hypothetical protein